MITGVRLLLLLLAVAAQAMAEDGVLRITIRDQATVEAAHATLDAVAVISGPEHLRQALGSLVVQDLPDLAPVTITAPLLRAALVEHRDVAMVIDGRGTVRRAATTLESQALAASARDALTERVGDGSARIEVRRPPRSLVVASDLLPQLEYDLTPLTADLWGEVPYRIRVMHEERELGRAMVVFHVTVSRSVPVAGRTLESGHVLQAHDIRFERQVLSRATGATHAGLEELVGRALRRRVAAGTVLSTALTAAPRLVRGGRTVAVVYRGAGFEMTASATALADGAAGDQIRVRLDNGTVTRGAVLDDGRVLLL